MKKILMIIIAIMAIILVLPIANLTGFTVNKIQEKLPNFKLSTIAVCDDNETVKTCKDKLFYKCEDVINEVVSGIIECNGKRYNISQYNLGLANYHKNWDDPRPIEWLNKWEIN